MKEPRGDWRRRAEQALERSGRRSGGARSAVVELLAREECCLSAREISDRLGASGQRIGIASVYRALEALDELGFVQRLDPGEGGSLYEAAIPGGEHHHHAVCERCGRVTAFEDPGLEQAIERLASRLDHRVSGHDVVIRGACPRCARLGARR
jgi:Fur family transcriptional regulator, ferric uptake regulator